MNRNRKRQRHRRKLDAEQEALLAVEKERKSEQYRAFYRVMEAYRVAEASRIKAPKFQDMSVPKNKVHVAPNPIEFRADVYRAVFCVLRDKASLARFFHAYGEVDDLERSKRVEKLPEHGRSWEQRVGAMLIRKQIYPLDEYLKEVLR
jgi:hypothetical protein